jgi:hypothetical protein
MPLPSFETDILAAVTSTWKGSSVCPISDRESGFLQRVMSALPPKADACGAVGNVGFGPKADMAAWTIVIGQ